CSTRSACARPPSSPRMRSSNGFLPRKSEARGASGHMRKVPGMFLALALSGAISSEPVPIRDAHPTSSSSREVPPMATSAIRLPIEGELPAFSGATAWINTSPLTPAGLRGNVVLVDFWTYTCVNWLRTLPYVRAWAAKYRDRGLVVVGAHTPEFSVEHDLAN